jgi:hypothetical protein
VKHITELQAEHRLNSAIYEMNRLDHQVCMLQIDLAHEVRRPGGSRTTDLALELEARIRAKQKELVAAIEQVRELKTAKFASKPPAQPKKLMIDYFGKYVPRNWG